MLRPYFADTDIGGNSNKYSKQFTVFDDFAVNVIHILSFEKVYVSANSTPQIHVLVISGILRRLIVSVLGSKTTPAELCAGMQNLYVSP